MKFSIKGGVNVDDAWPPSVGNSWRTTTDIQNYWSSIVSSIDCVITCYYIHYSYIIIDLFS